MDRTDKILTCLFAALIVSLVAAGLIGGEMTEMRYYQCVYNIKSAGLTPTDIKAICER